MQALRKIIMIVMFQSCLIRPGTLSFAVFDNPLVGAGDRNTCATSQCMFFETPPKSGVQDLKGQIAPRPQEMRYFPEEGWNMGSDPEKR